MILSCNEQIVDVRYNNARMYAEVVTCIASCRAAEGLPGYPQGLTCQNKLV
jgi:hypothetical protein